MCTGEHLIHFTNLDALRAILDKGEISASDAFNRDRTVVSFTEEGEHERMLSERVVSKLDGTRASRRYGIAFKKRWLIEKFGANRVWYVECDTRLYDRVKDIPALQDYLERVDEKPGSRHSWAWEREWRVTKNVGFKRSDVCFLIGNTSSDRERLKRHYSFKVDELWE